MDNWKRPAGFSQNIPTRELYLLLEGDLSELSSLDSSDEEEEPPKASTFEEELTSVAKYNVEFEVSLLYA